jgi:mycoketide-CoA synthase
MSEPISESFHPNFPTLVDALRWWSEKTPDRPAIAFLSDGENETARLTYAELDREVRRVAASLQQFLDPGSRALLCFPPGLDFLVAYLGCLYAQVIAVPVFAPRNARHLGRLSAVAADAEATVALTNAKTVRSFQTKKMTTSTLGLPWLVVEAIGTQASAPWRAPEISPSDTAFLQYTSGSTAAPNGVVVAHENLAVNIGMMSRAFDNHIGTRCVSWLPVHHDMGLIGCVLMPLWQGLFTVIMPPASFAQKPVRWLRAISKYQATFIVSPNFGYDLCCRQMDPNDIADLDLSSVEVACNGAEPIRAETLEEFCRLFGPAGFRRSSFVPCYGLAEATLYASGHHLGPDPGIIVDKASFELGKVVLAAEGASAQRVVSCGAPPTGESIAIVDTETMSECPPDETGEIWLAGDHIAQGYWNNPSATTAVFGATVPTRSGTTFLRTGDLGFVREGQLFVTGRLKDIIIAFGRNHYPQDIEATVEDNAAIRAGNSVAFALASEESEGIGIVAEIEMSYLRSDLTQVAEAISEAIWEEHEVSVFQIAFLKPAALPKTSSGKLQRRHTRDLLLASELTEVFRWPEPRAERQGEAGRAAAAEQAVAEPGPTGESGAAGSATLRQRLLSLPATSRERALLDLVRGETRIVLGRSSRSGLDADRPLRELGLDSLRAADLRNRLAAATGLQLPATLLFDYPTPSALAGYLTTLLGFDAGSPAAPISAPAAAADEAIAIVSMSCRFPGGAVTPEALWELLAQGRDAVSEFPRSRGWDAVGDDGNQMPVGGFLPQVDEFDPGFFGISAREAVAIDPQQRLLLEMSWEALERAGIVPASLQGSPSGVYVGISPDDYGVRLRESGAVPATLKGYLGTGSQPSVASGRIAYTLGLEGPAISVDTSCSSSLVAVHLACQALRQGECSLAFAGGVTVIVTPAVFSEMSPESAGAPDGRCKAFSAEADGAGWSEGAGMVLLERLSDAQRNAHPILAVVRGSAVNQDGRSQGLTAPNGPSQERVIRQALASARLSASEIDAVEAHGTGTTLGDPIEAQALLATYGQAHTQDRPLWLGSLKSNLGHTQSAAGIGGLIKMVLALQHRVLPKTLHAGNPSPHIDWSAGTVRLLHDAIEWAGNGQVRRAGISAFGVSGTNAHMIVEEPPPAEEPSAKAAALPEIPLPVLLSGRSEGALRAQAEALRTHLVSRPGLRLADLAYSLATTRSHFEHRAVVVARDTLALGEQLQALAAGKPAPGTVLGQRNVSGKVAFVFPGHGAQWTGMAMSLLGSSPVFRGQVEACEGALAPHVDWSLTAVLRGLAGAPDMDDVDVVQPALFAVTVALAAVWRSIGIEPDAVVGHSLGEIAAAYVAGALSLEDAAKVAALRGQALKQLAGRGAMAAVELPEDELLERLERFGDRLSIAAVNSPATLLVSGPTGDVDALVRELTEARVFARKVRIDYASHCGQIDAIEDKLRSDLAGLAPRASAIPFYSAVAGAPLDTTQLDADYWYRNLRQQVRFAAASQRLLADGYRFFIEASPHPALVLSLLQTLEGAEVPTAVTGTLRRNTDGLTCLLLSLGALHSRGLSLDWKTFFQPLRPRRVGLPTYAFQRERFWLEDHGPQSADVTSAGLATADHPLLGAAITLAGSGALVLTGRISLSRHPWLASYTVFGRVILPGSVFVELALAAAHRTGLDQVAELTLETALALPAEGGVTVQLTVGPPDDNGRRPMALHARDDDAAADLPWTRHASGFLGPAARPAPSGLQSWPPVAATPLSLDGFYDRSPEAGLGYGPAFQGLRAAWRRDEELFAEVQLPASLTHEVGQFALHPALLDAALHVAALGAAGGGAQVDLPFCWAGVYLHAVGATTFRARLAPAADGQTATLQLADATGEPVATVAALTTRPVRADQLRDELAAGDHHSLLRIDWTEASGVPGAPEGRIAVVGSTDLDSAFHDAAPRLEHHADLAALTRVLGHGSPPPDVVIIPRTAVDRPCDTPAAAHAATAQSLALLQGWLADERLACCRLVLLTRRAVATAPDEEVQDLAQAPLWGLARTAQAEHPDRAIRLIDTDDSDASRRALAAAVLATQPQIALRAGRQLVPRLTRARDALTEPDSAAWRLDIPAKGTLDGLTLTACPEAATPLADGQVRVAVHAAGLNFRDVLAALASYPGHAGPLGSEGAGTVTDTGPGVTKFAPGDRVMGLLPAAFGPVATADQSLLAPMSAGWSFTTAASIPVAFLTAYQCLVDLADIRPGERVLVHSATGGVGMAAVQLARHLGAEVFATASPSKWDVLHESGFDAAHVASSRSPGFEQHFLRSTHGRGMNAVLGSLTGELTDASLRLLPDGGRYIEIGKSDVRDPAQVAADHPGVAYQAFDLTKTEHGRIGQVLAELAELFERGVIHPLPTAPRDIRLAARAFRVMAQAQHVGKLVLTLPRPVTSQGTVLITGGTGTLGGLVARHLVHKHDVRHLLLTSRQGQAAAGAQALRQELEAAGARVTLTACDCADRAAVQRLLAAIPPAHPLQAVVHAAGVLDDAVLTALTPGHLGTVMRAKVDAAWHLHELTQALDLSAFVLFSSAAGVLGSPGQANYAAASTFLDALAHHRRARGLQALALDWGLWAEPSNFTAHLGRADHERIARAGIRALTTREGLALLDAALRQPHPALTAAHFDPTALAAHAQTLPPILRGLTQATTQRRAASNTPSPATLKQRLLSLSPPDAVRLMLDLVRAEAAVVLGLAPPSMIEAERSLESIGLDSLRALELRNRLSAVLGLALPLYLMRERGTVVNLARAILEKTLMHMTSQGNGKSGAPADSESEAYQQEIL